MKKNLYSAILIGGLLQASGVEAVNVSEYVEFESPKSYDEGEKIFSIVAGKFRAGNVSDIAYILGDPSGGNSSIYYRLSNGASKSFSDKVLVNGDHAYQKLWSVDVTGDGLEDLVVTDNLANVRIIPATGSAATPFTYDNHITLSFKISEAPPAGNSPVTVVKDLSFGDFNGDGRPDILLAGITQTADTSGNEKPTGQVYMYGNAAIALNQGNGHFSTPDLAYTAAVTHGEIGGGLNAYFDSRATAGDFDGDGKVDAAICYHMQHDIISVDPSAVIYSGNGSGSLGSDYTEIGYKGCEDISSVYPRGPFTRYASPGEKATLIIADTSSSTVLTYDNANWDTPSTKTKMDETPRGPMGPSADFNRDGVADQIFLNGHDSMLVVGWNWDNTEDRKVEGDYDLRLGTDIQRGDYGDFNGDGLADIVGTDDEKFNVYYNKTEESSIVFFNDKECKDTVIGEIPGDVTANYNFKDKGSPVPNDDAESLSFRAVARGTKITVYDSPSMSTDDDYSIITINTTEAKSHCVDTFQMNWLNPYFTIEYHEDNGLNDKVSAVSVELP